MSYKAGGVVAASWWNWYQLWFSFKYLAVSFIMSTDSSLVLNYIPQTWTILISRQERNRLGFGYVLQCGLPPQSCEVLSTGKGQTQRQYLFTGFSTGDYWQGWLIADLLYWWDLSFTSLWNKTSCIRSSWVIRRPLAATFTLSPGKNKLVVYVAMEIFRGNLSPVHSLIKLHMKKKRGIKPLIFKLLCFCSVSPTKKLKYFCFCTSAAAAPYALLPHPPEPFVLVTLLTWCSHHGPRRHSHLRQRAANRETWQSNVEIILTITLLLFYRGSIQVPVKTVPELAAKTERFNRFKLCHALGQLQCVIILVVLRPYQSSHS